MGLALTIQTTRRGAFEFGKKRQVPEDGREVGPRGQHDAPEVDHVAEEDGQGADEEADANGEEHDQHEAHDKPQDVDGGHHAVEDHDDGDGR